MKFNKLAKQIKASRSIIVCTNESGDVWCGTSVDGDVEAMYLGGGLTPRISAESLEICLDIPNKDRGGIDKYEFAEDWEFTVYLMDELEGDREVTEKIRTFEFSGKRFCGFNVSGRFYFVPSPLFAPLGELAQPSFYLRCCGGRFFIAVKDGFVLAGLVACYDVGAAVIENWIAEQAQVIGMLNEHIAATAEEEEDGQEMLV